MHDDFILAGSELITYGQIVLDTMAATSCAPMTRAAWVVGRLASRNLEE
jgi:hypothetical protein